MCLQIAANAEVNRLHRADLVKQKAEAAEAALAAAQEHIQIAAARRAAEAKRAEEELKLVAEAKAAEEKNRTEEAEAARRDAEIQHKKKAAAAKEKRLVEGELHDA